MYVHGIDIIEISRVSKAHISWGERFLKRIYTEGEIQYCSNRAPELAARFAAKEAVMKALSTGHIGISPQDIEVLPDANGTPVLNLKGSAQARAHQAGIRNLVVSLSHSKDYAIASVIGESG